MGEGMRRLRPTLLIDWNGTERSDLVDHDQHAIELAEPVGHGFESSFRHRRYQRQCFWHPLGTHVLYVEVGVWEHVTARVAARAEAALAVGWFAWRLNRGRQ